jgi:carbonic anhydrase
VGADAVQAPPTADDQAAATPQDVLDRLRAGATRAAAGNRRSRDVTAERTAVAGGQHPLAAVVGCIDSRVPPEVVFDAGLGELFACRTAGTVVDEDVLGGLEFACALSGVPLVVVLGHTACGAVTGACAGVELGHLTGLLARIRPAVVEETPGADDPDLVERVVVANVRRQVALVLDESPVLADLVTAGDVAVVGAVYDLDTGEVEWLR